MLPLANGCQQPDSVNEPEEASEKLSFRPHVLWLVTEDMGPYLPAFGDSTIQTPNLSRLAAEGIRYPNLFSPSGVCAPSRAAIAMGLYPSSFGANHMRTSSHREFTGLPTYEAVPPPEAKMMSQVLREQGYYCTNNFKEDYQFQKPVTAWDESGPFAHWRNRSDGQPFFSIFNFTETHESGLFEPYGFRNIEQRHYSSGDTTFDVNAGSDNVRRGRMSEEETTVHVAKDLDFPIPPYLPDTETIRRDMWKMYNNIAEMDRQVGAILDQLEADGLLDSTIIFFYADHGGPLPRQKRLIYDSGLNSPMIVRFPNGWKAGDIDEQLVSFVDFAPTVLSLADIQPPSYLHGQAFLGEYQVDEERDYVYAAADRFDEFTDAIRAVRDPQFKYIRNYRPEQGYYLPISYREQIPSMKELRQLQAEGTLNENQAQWFREGKPREELFDCKNDPYELHNLASDPQYTEKLTELRAELDTWINAVGDQPNLPERELIEQLWNGQDEQPTTSAPEVEASNQQIAISCPTEGANIGYQIVNQPTEAESWQVYTEPFTAPEGSQISVQAHRIGYQPSKVIEVSLP
ncbi:MAG: sulfatase-like hydrolase/transferase [Tunicatimonas sp.]|uniref:sulfatase-like hydrolase/transferase n=1 Tax=Tunicatimonas sp. TaxID=1940096 RepID=UPI003C7540C9